MPVGTSRSGPGRVGRSASPEVERSRRERRVELTETAIIAAVPAAETLVRHHRDALDPAAALGVPAHVTVLYPFVAPPTLSEEVISRAEGVAATLHAVHARFTSVAWFGEQVVYLVPEPDDWFRAATDALHAAFPLCPPYRGAYEDVVPHLTIGNGGSVHALRRAAEEVRAGLPVSERIERLLLMGGSDAAGSWRTLRELPLAGSGTALATPIRRSR